MNTFDSVQFEKLLESGKTNEAENLLNGFLKQELTLEQKGDIYLDISALLARLLAANSRRQEVALGEMLSYAKELKSLEKKFDTVSSR